MPDHETTPAEPDDDRTTAQICADILVELGRISGLIDAVTVLARTATEKENQQ